MQKIILLITVMVLSACASMPAMKSVAGTYENTEGGSSDRFVFLENGAAEAYINGKKAEEEAKWEISKEGELYVTDPDGDIEIARINKDRSITLIARIDADGKRKDIPKEGQPTAKKIK